MNGYLLDTHVISKPTWAAPCEGVVTFLPET